MTDADIIRLERAAKNALEATDGLWDVCSEKSGPISEYVTIANPAFILAFIKEHRQVCKELFLYDERRN